MVLSQIFFSHITLGTFKKSYWNFVHIIRVLVLCFYEFCVPVCLSCFLKILVCFCCLVVFLFICLFSKEIGKEREELNGWEVGESESR